MMVQVPLIVDAESGINDMLDRDGSRTPIQFHISNDYDKHPIDAQVVQAATKWKRLRAEAVRDGRGRGHLHGHAGGRKDYFLDHDHSAYVDQWDWEKVVTAEQRNLAYLKETVTKIWKVLKGAERRVQEDLPQLKGKYPDMPDKIEFLHAEDILEMYPQPAEEAARDRHPAEASRHLHHRHRLGTEERTSPRDEGCRLRRLGHRNEVARRKAHARAQRRHPRLEPGHEAEARADLHGS